MFWLTEIVVTKNEKALSVTTRDLDVLSPCNHEEGDTRILLHVADCARLGHRQIIIRTVDSDVVVIAVAAYHLLDVDELWVAIGTGDKYRYMPVHIIASQLGPRRSAALPIFHAITGCDTVSQFKGRGKPTAWEVWTIFPDATNAFIELGNCTESISEECMAIIERFVVLLYDRACKLSKVGKGNQRC